MSMYGPPGGGQYPGAPQDPWQSGSGDPYGGNPYGGQPGGDPYGQPSGAPYGPPPPYGQPGGTPYDPYGQPSGPPGGDPWAAQQPMPPGPPISGPPGQPWGPPPGPKHNTGLVVGLAAVAILVLVLGAVVVFLVLDRDRNTPIADPSPTAEVSTPASEAPTSEAPTDQPTKYDIDDAEEGDCLYDSNPSNTSANLSFVSCEERGRDHYRVLKRFDGTTDEARCEDVRGYETSFTSSSDRFVLCVEKLF